MAWALGARPLEAIAGIPFGQTRNYTEMATRAGNERAVRAAGTACGRNPLPLVHLTAARA